ncbi:MAG: hypothetical protein H8E98_07020 [Bacteroidetes bacterium]|nr:hypothetical protein [Bacteroidota bacterium]
MLRKSIIISLFLLILSSTFSQNYGRRSYLRNNPLKKSPSIGISAGMMNFQGDYGSYSIGYPQYGAELFLDYRYNGTFGISVNGTYGRYAEKFDGGLDKLNFYSNFYGGNINILIHLNSVFNMHRRSPISPFITGGAGLIVFNTNAMDKDENKIWKDQKKDYNNYTFVFPVGFGLKYQLSEKVELMFSSKFNYTMSDFLDHRIAYSTDDNNKWKRSNLNEANDTFVYTSVSVMYSFGRSRFKRAKRRIRSLPSYRY